MATQITMPTAVRAAAGCIEKRPSVSGRPKRRHSTVRSWSNAVRAHAASPLAGPGSSGSSPDWSAVSVPVVIGPG